MEPIPTWEHGVKQVAPNVYAYLAPKSSWYWSNAGFIEGRDYVVVVDSLATVGLTEQFKNEIRKITDKPIRYLINTHFHGDHTYGNHVFSGATIISHKNCRHELMESTLLDPGLGNMVFPDFDFNGIALSPADITMDRELSIHTGDQEVRCLYLGPGHSLGDIVVYLPKDGIIFAGDLLFLYSTPLAQGGSFAGWIKDLDEMVKLGAKTYVPGHGPVCAMEGLQQCREYLILVQREAKKRFDKGMSSDDVAKDIDLGTFRNWVNRERILANVERLKREFCGEDPATSKLDETDLFIRMAIQAEAGIL